MKNKVSAVLNKNWTSGCIAGIDPGKISGLAVLSQSGTLLYHTQGSPVSVWEPLSFYRPDLVVLEKVSARPKQGVVSTCTFCKTFGFWEGILTALELPYVLVSPTRWKKILDSGKRDKSHVVEWVNRMFGLKLKKSYHHEAEAIAMAWWGLKNQR